ncbi:hypothetical protein ACWGJ0_30940 [Streptomyces massasporeus]
MTRARHPTGKTAFTVKPPSGAGAAWKSPGTWKYTTGKIWVVINKAGNVVSVGRD